MRIVLFGAYGQLGSDLRTRLPGEVVPLRHADVEITRRDEVEAALTRAAPDAVVNAAAYNLVDRAEDEPELPYAVNALGPRNLALACAARNLTLLHVSTDYVFSGVDDLPTQAARRDVPYAETDRPAPLSAYAVSKLAGEHFVSALCPRHFIVRTCGLYGHNAAHGKGNFVETMLRLGRQRPELRVVCDQRCTPTASADLAEAIAALIATDAFGLYHATNAGDAAWHEFAAEIFRLARLDVAVQAIRSAEYGAKARRPAYSVLDSSKLAAVIGRPMRPWQDALAEYIAGRPAD